MKLVGAQVVVDLSNSPSFEDEEVLRFFETSGRNLLAAEGAAGVGHHVALSVVGTDRLLESGYFRGKIDSHEVVTDNEALYFGVRLDDRSLVPGDDARIGAPRFEDWLRRASRR